LRWLTEAALGRADDGGRGVEETLGRWIARGPQEPFFWFVNLMECHSPYLPPRSAGRVSLADRLRAADDARRYYTLDAICRACLGGFDVPDATIERMRRLYALSIHYMDAVLGRTLDRLAGAGLLDDTLVLVTADHGENFGEGGMLAHTLSLDDRLIHVPLVAAGPGADDLDVRSLADLPRLLAEVAEIDEHPWHDLPRGMGLAQFDPPAEPDDPTVPGHIERWGLGDDAFQRFTTPLSCAVANGLKLLRRGDRDELYDLSADPLELAPMPVSAPPQGRERELAALQAALDHPAMTATFDTSATPPGDHAQPDEEEAREIERRMKMLGYM
jgi:arylsulfatase A-like enzyme